MFKDDMMTGGAGESKMAQEWIVSSMYSPYKKNNNNKDNNTHNNNSNNFNLIKTIKFLFSRGFDYKNVEEEQVTMMNLQPVKEGEPTSIKCESSEEFDNCKFQDPHGKIHQVGIGGGSYNSKKRVDCLCLEEEYDPTMVCGIYIRNTRKEDMGNWRYQGKRKFSLSNSSPLPRLGVDFVSSL